MFTFKEKKVVGVLEIKILSLIFINNKNNMSIQTKDEAQDKASNRVDRSLKKKTKYKPLNEETWGELTRRGASLKEQLEWIHFRKKQKDKNG